MDVGLNGKVALVTGAGRGVGREIAASLAREGASVAINYRASAKDAEALVAEITAAGGKARAYQADVADFAAVTAMIDGGRQGLRAARYPDQQCRARAAPALRRDHAGGLASPDRRVSLRRDPLLPRRGAASRSREERPHHRGDRRLLARRQVRARDRRGRARRRGRADEVAGARVRPLRHHLQHGLARAGRDRSRQGLGRSRTARNS